MVLEHLLRRRLLAVVTSFQQKKKNPDELLNSRVALLSTGGAHGRLGEFPVLVCLPSASPPSRGSH